MLFRAENPAMSYSASTGEELLSEADWNRNWRIAYCKPRQEKALARELQKRNVSYFLPMIERVYVSGGRRRRGLNPLFPSYLFLASRDSDSADLQGITRIVHFLPARNIEQLTLRKELQSLDACLRGSPTDIEVYNHLVTGTRVRITGGALRDWEGVVLDASRPHKVWVGVSSLGRGVVVEVHGDLLTIN